MKNLVGTIILSLVATQASTQGTKATPTAAAYGAALEQPSLNWGSGGDGAWTIETVTGATGGTAAKAGAVAAGQASFLTANITGPGRLSFSWKVSSELYYDRLRFYLDGVLADVTSGDVDWATGTYYLTPGSHTLRWEYAKDGQDNSGTDTCYLDNVQMTSTGGWRPTLPASRAGAATAVDTSRNRLILFGGISDTEYSGDTWESDGTTWKRLATTGPEKRSDATMAYDSTRRRVVLFGGLHPLRGRLADTWEWDGTNWTQMSPTASPGKYPARMAYSPSEGRCVLYESETGATWKWDGVNWIKASTTGPGQRYYPGFACDTTRSRVVLFGGGADGVYRDDTWEWDGTNWTRMARLGPEPRQACSMAFDASRQRTVLVGGVGNTGTISGTWEWDGVKWRWITATAPVTPSDSPLAYLPSLTKCLLFHDTDTSLYSWDGTNWAGTSYSGPGARWNHAMAYDSVRKNVVVFGGNYDGYGAYNLGDTWLWDGAKWTASTATGPSARSLTAMVFQTPRNRALLFGGATWDSTNSVLSAQNDTWEWNGTIWSSVSATGPSARYLHGLAYDTARQRAVLFGGSNGTNLLGDTWEFNGTAWTQVSTSGPAARAGAALAYSPTRQRVVLYGGITASGYSSETWEWNGSAWTASTATGPTARAYPGFAYFGDRDQIVLTGGYSDSGALSDTWEYSAAGAWTLVPYSGVGQRYGVGTVYDSTNKKLILFGGSYSSANDTWEFSQAVTPIVATGFVLR